ncbi:hypothetical protein [Streptomyces sp. NPDC055287]
MSTTKRAIAAVILMGAALSVPTQAYAADANQLNLPVIGEDDRKKEKRDVKLDTLPVLGKVIAPLDKVVEPLDLDIL